MKEIGLVLTCIARNAEDGIGASTDKITKGFFFFQRKMIV